MSRGMVNHILETYKKSIMPHVCRGYQTASYMAMDIMCAYHPSQYALAHWKFVLLYCVNLPRIDLPSQELDNHHSSIFSTIRFRFYHLILNC